MTDFHVDSLSGNDAHDGSSPELAWRTIDRVHRQTLAPGDRLLFKRGCTWREALRLAGRGTPSAPIIVSTYGSGPRPRLMADGTVVANSGSIAWLEVRGLEVCGTAPFDPHAREQGEQHGIAFSCAESAEGLRIVDCVVHDVSGKGIQLNALTTGTTIFSDWRISDCEVYHAGTGIATDGPWPPLPGLESCFLCHARYLVERCRVHDIATDGIVLYYCQDGIIEHCTAWRTGIGRCQRTPVGIWLFIARRCIIQHCESYDNHTAGGKADGGGFDLDGGCIDCIMQYNYSHDNDGAGFLVCSWDPAIAPTLRCTTRFNLSVNDGRANDYASLQFWQADACQTYNNTCITRISSCLKFASPTSDLLFANNLFIIDSDRDIALVKASFPMTSNRFEHNLHWRRGGAARFEVGDRLDLDLAGWTNAVSAGGEIEADPRLSALAGSRVIPLSDSPALHSGTRIPGMGTRDLYGNALTDATGVGRGAANTIDRLASPLDGAAPGTSKNAGLSAVHSRV